jgi:hypothetical protein
MTALAAHEVSRELRSARGRLRAQLRSGEITPASVLLERPECARDMRVLDVLDASRGISGRALRRFNVAAAREWVNLLTPVGELTDRQRDWLAREVPLLPRQRPLALAAAIVAEAA